MRDELNIPDSKKIFLYQGLLEAGRGIEKLTQVFQELYLREEDKAVLIFLGMGSLESYIQEVTKNCPIIFYHPAVPHKDLVSWTSSADYGLCFIENTCRSYELCMPNKFFEYLMGGIPVFIPYYLKELTLLLNQFHVGEIAESIDINYLCSFFKKQIENVHDYSSAIELFKKNYCWEVQELLLKQVYCEKKGSMN